MRKLLLAALPLALLACSGEETSATAEPPATDADAVDPVKEAVDTAAADMQLVMVLDGQADETKARYQYRHPKDTMEFLGIMPGMTVADTLPGSVWYAGILSQYLGAEGHVIGANYSLEQRMAMGGRYASDEWQEENREWPTNWAEERNSDLEEDNAPFSAFFYGGLPEDMHGTADVVMMVRAFHHLNRTEEEGGYRTQALTDAYNLLKPGGIVGVVQHRAPEANSDEWAVGNNGYVKQSHVIAVFEEAGFELAEQSEINANPKDQPTEEDYVWRLPPTLGGASREDEDIRATMQAIGESDRMTLKFRKLQ